MSFVEFECFKYFFNLFQLIILLNSNDDFINYFYNSVINQLHSKNYLVHR